MSEEKTAGLYDVLRAITLMGGTITILIGGGKFVLDAYNAVATKEYHDSDRRVVIEQVQKQIEIELLPLKESVENTEASAIVPRISNILSLKCRTEIPVDVENILQKQLARYRELNGRDFAIGGCRDGKRVSAYELTNGDDT